MDMDRSQRDILVSILTEYEKLLAENLCMQALLGVVQKHGAFSNFAEDGKESTWRAEVDLLMAGPTRRTVKERFAPILLQVEKAFVDSELRRLLAEIPLKGPVN